MRSGALAVWNARELLWSFVRRDLTVRYRHALLGVSWAVLTPLFQSVIFTLIFSRVVRFETGLPYPLYAFSGLAVWSFTASALRSAVSSLSGNAFLVSKVAFERQVLPLASVLVAAVDFAVSLCVVAALMWYYGVPVHATVLALPVILLVQLAFTTGLALLLAAANLLWHDVRYVFEVLVTLWMFASSVLYPVPRLGGIAGAVLAMNPMTPIIDAYRDVLLRGTLPPSGTLASSIAVAVITLAAGGLLFQRAEPRFAELA
jgi:ABC-type polysaccharide/polyol phosphate export permease